jgi:hypothetical protein
VGVWGLGLGPNPPTPNPQSPIPNPHRIYISFKYIISLKKIIINSNRKIIIEKNAKRG